MHHKQRSGVKWAAMLGGTLIGLLLNTIAVQLVAPHLPSAIQDLDSLFIIAIFAGSGICGAQAFLWAERRSEGRD